MERDIDSEPKYDLKFVERLQKSYDEGIRSILFTSHEPTLNNDLAKMLRAAKKIGFNVCLITNGRRISDERYLASIIGNIDQITVSLHGHTAKIHDAIARTPNSFEQTVRGLELLAKTGVKLYTNTTITRSNLGHLKDIVKFLSKFQPEGIVLNPAIPIGRAHDHFDQVMVRYTEIAKVIDTIQDSKVTVNGFPRCLSDRISHKEQILLMHGDEESELESDYLKSKSPKCSSCIHVEGCEGIWESYLKRYGDGEFEPQ